MEVDYGVIAKLKGIKAVLYSMAEVDVDIIDQEYIYILLGHVLDDCIKYLERFQEK